MQKKKSKKEEKKEKIKIEPTVKDVFPLQYYDEELEAFLFGNGLYMDLLEVVSKDRVNSDNDEIEFDVLNLAKFYKTNSEAIKWISLNFPVDTKVQREHKEKILERTNDPVRRLWLKRQIREMIKIDQNIQKRESYLQIFAKNKTSLIKQRDKVIISLGRGRNGILKEISKEKKISILYKLNNMSSVIKIPETEEDYYD